ncbi:hypothetical protein LTR70_004642 [Exophiala xenobiotica]|uniref:Uncharacterized protein n=1 Tax=Lithohypha guttulata TaxID=1690604 RepID=A0ABR0KCP0_9EURO|nr:hypothetical protein LTR24_004238 [Lithohypha guttulata]KAK5320279.1 hypothetical protein LTR70_004642 [Exophiala xenobiotica]
MTNRQLGNARQVRGRNNHQPVGPIRSEPLEWRPTVGINAPPPNAPREAHNQPTSAQEPTGQTSPQPANAARKRGHSVRFGEQPDVREIERRPSTGHDSRRDQSASWGPSTSRDRSRGRFRSPTQGRRQVKQDGWPASASGGRQTGYGTARSEYIGRNEDEADYTDYNRGRSAQRDWYAARSERSESRPRTRFQEYSHPDLLYGVAWEKDPSGQYFLPMLKCYEAVHTGSTTSRAHFVGTEIDSTEITTQNYDFEERMSGARYRSASVSMRVMVRTSDGLENGFHASDWPTQDRGVAPAHSTTGYPDSLYPTYDVEERGGNESWEQSRRQSGGVYNLTDAERWDRRGRRGSSAYYSRTTSSCARAPPTAGSHPYNVILERGYGRPPPYQPPGILKPPRPELPPGPGQQPQTTPQPYLPEAEYVDAEDTEPPSGGSDRRGRSYSRDRSPSRSGRQSSWGRYSFWKADSDGNERLVYDDYYDEGEGSGYESPTPLEEIKSWVRDRKLKENWVWVIARRIGEREVSCGGSRATSDEQGAGREPAARTL